MFAKSVPICAWTVPSAIMREQDIMAVIRGRAPLADSRVILGPGDDLAALQAGSGGALLVGVDQVVDGLHVIAADISWDRIGRKAVNRSLSDIAAMAGRPLATLASVVLPADASSSEVEALCRGLNLAASDWEAPLVGGDVALHRTSDGPLTVSVTVLATAHEACGPVTRSGGQHGDLLVVTGSLGGSLEPDGTGSHLDFCPRIDEALAAADSFGPALHAMIDISDGLGRDAGRIAEASGLQARLDMHRLPQRGTASPMDALQDGEDYELLMAVSADCDLPDALTGRMGPCPLSVVGSLQPMAGGTDHVIVTSRDGAAFEGSQLGWDHG